MRKKHLIPAIAGIMAVALLSGCGASGSSTTSVTSEISTSVTVSTDTSATSVSADTSVSTSSTETSVSTEEPDPSAFDENAVLFNTYDRDGNIFTESIFSDYEITMINFWEPWCGPCISEMPGLAKLYEDYTEKGLMILGVYGDTSMEEDVDYILQMTEVTYPILYDFYEFAPYRTVYVPTTIFVDKEGHVIDFGIEDPYSDGPMIVGSRSYEDWEELIKSYLER